MCGICGVVYKDTQHPADGHLLSFMCKTIAHRGPDAEGLFVDGHIGLGSRRLSIIDLAGSDQPIYNEERSIAIVFNGEIYNYPSLRCELEAAGHSFYTNGDTETIIHGYEQWGMEVVERLNGMFAFALWDAARRRLFIARDMTGIKPLYYTQTSDGLIFGSEIKAILAHPGVERRIDPAALDAYLSFEYVPAPLSIFEGIYKLPPGHYLVLDNGTLRIEPYWDIHLERSERTSSRREAELVAGFPDLLHKAVEMEMIADVPVGVLLSGGIDSSLVAAMMARVSPGNIQSFTIAMDDPSFDESEYAGIVAQHVGTQHHVKPITAGDLLSLVPTISAFMDEPLADSSIIPTTILSQFAREHVKLVLGGDGGDELFAGYSTLQAHRLMTYYERLVPRFLRQGLVRNISSKLPTSFDNISLDFKIKRFAGGSDMPPAIRHQQWLGSFTTEEKHHLLVPELRREEAETYAWVDRQMQNCQADQLMNRILYQDMKMYMEGDILVKTDRASMSASLEVRVPLLNKLLLDFAAELPHSQKLHGLTTKYLLRQVADGLLPRRIVKRGKKGFNIPVAKWLAGPLLGLTRDMLHPERLKREGFFVPEAVQGLLDDHIAHRYDARKLLWTLLTFEMWYETWGG
ncbi:MAG: asparagine synthase (glutamine-hydrolyzing) [Anaerolineae bacterium]|nr:asparagine synthase (glutamine-hydrolyzing) [Anaerolineae bacterium]